MAEKMLLEDQIRHNKAVTVRLFLILFLILFAVVFGVGFYMGVAPWFTAGFALVFGLFYLWMASSFSIPAILKSARARPANPNVREEKLLIYAVDEMAIAAGLPAPKVYVQEDNDINAFATGKNPKDSIICVTTGALRALDREELQGVIGHEMSHIRNYDIRVTTYAIALIGIIAMVGEIVLRSVFFGGHRHGNKQGGHPIMFLIALVIIILAPILSRMVYFAISRRREYLADASGAQLTRNPEGLARALQKIGGTQPEPSHGDRTVASLYLDNPFRRGVKESAFSTHPPIEKRIERLRQM